MKTRSEVIAHAESYVGVKQGTKKHKALVDQFNKAKIKPAGSVEKANYECAWCAIFATDMLLYAGLSQKKAPMSYNCGNLITRAKALGIWIENDAYSKMKPTDLIIYYWDDTSGKTKDCKSGASHVGVIQAAPDKNGYFTVIEGNKGVTETCGIRKMHVNDPYIRGFIQTSKLIPTKTESKTETKTEEKKTEEKKVETKTENKETFKKGVTYVVKPAEGLNVRQKASKTSKKLGAIPKGTAVVAEKVSGDWIRITTIGKLSGWICGKDGSSVYLKVKK